MSPHTLSREDAVLLIIDPQEKLLPKVFQPERVTANTILLARFARIMDLPVVVTTQYEKGIGPIVEEIAGEIATSPPIDKVEFGCFGNATFVKHLEQIRHGRNTLILSGIESHICVAQTALGALEMGYVVHVASDAISSRTEWNWKIGLDRMGQAGAIISSTEMIIYEGMKRSDLSEFKAMLPHLRRPVET
ncbi:MAG: hydrolase [Thermodesulfobacteriota bacterium]|nr:hydrolase [Thermodesulfobacteriota bacterium]